MGYNGPKTKMKKTLLVALAVLLAYTGFAQQRLATLNHNDTIRTFYGQSALSQAHAAAVNGDIIMLSSGLFDAIEITKAVTIRGSGMWPIDSLNIENTVISGNMTLNVPYDSLHNLEIEGMKFISYINFKQATNPVFRKCRMTSSWSKINNGTMNGAQFYHCVLNSYNGNGLTGTQFINSVILSLSAPSTLMNCVAEVYYSSTLNGMTVYNSIIYYESPCGSYTGDDYNSSSCYYSVGINKSSCGYNNRYFDVTNVINHHLINKYDYNQVFKYFNGTYSEGMSFELQDDIATTILGDDSTQVGIYGGQFPFDPVVHPVIGGCHVARRTNADMKLEVSIDLIKE